MSFVSAFLASFMADETASAGIEYALVAALVGAALIVGGAAFGTAVNARLQAVGDKVASVP